MKKTSKIIENEILDLYLNQKLSTTEVGKSFGISSTAVANILKRNSFQRRSISNSKKGKLRSSLLPVSDIINLYKQNLTSQQIANKCNCSCKSVLNVLRSNNILVRPGGRFNYTNPMENEIKELYSEEKKTIKEVCKLTKMSYSGINKILKKLNVLRTEDKHKGMIGKKHSNETKEKVRATKKQRKEDGLYDHIYLKKTGHTYIEFNKRLPEFKKYFNGVRCETKKQPLNQLENYEKRGKTGVVDAYHLDHKYSIYFGFKNNIPTQIIGNICNLEMIPWKENVTKNLQCSITLDELLKNYNN